MSWRKSGAKCEVSNMEEQPLVARLVSDKVAASMDLPRRFAFVLCVCAPWFVAPGETHAQAGSTSAETSGGEEIILDPELAAQGVSPVSSAGDELVIEDPELAGISSSASSSDGFSNLPETQRFLSEARLVVHSRLGMDLRQSDAREETWENTNIALLEATVRRSETLRFSMGTRLRLYAGALSHDVPDAQAQRVELDATPTSGYVDWNLATGLHLQVGYQSVQLGRFDIISATDVLTIADTRNGPATLPEAYDVGQLAVRVDYDPSDWLSLRGIYIPFFTPYIVSVSESDYGVLPLRQSEVDAEVEALGLTRFLSDNLSRADRERLAATGLSAFAPEVGLEKQQAALRTTAHGAFGEISLTAATAVEKLPSVYFTPEAIAYLADQKTPEVAEAFEMVERPIWVAYNRFTMLSMDAAFDVPPTSLGFEVAYMFGRTLATLGHGPYPGTLPLAERSDVLQVGARLEYLKGSELFTTIEAFGLYAMRAPTNPTRGWMFLEDGRYLAGAAAGAGWMPVDTHLKLELGVMAMTGPTFVFAPRVGYAVTSGVEIEIGALVIEGPAPPLSVTPRIAIGTIYDTIDQVYAGFIVTL